MTKRAVSGQFLRRRSAAARFFRQGVAGFARWRRVGAGTDGIRDGATAAQRDQSIQFRLGGFSHIAAMAGVADGRHKVGFHILLLRIGNGHLRNIDIKAKAAASFISLSVAIGGLATQPVNNSARQVLTDISRIFIFSSFCVSQRVVYMSDGRGALILISWYREGVFFGNWPELLKLS